jgi:hypothetical protein
MARELVQGLTDLAAERLGAFKRPKRYEPIEALPRNAAGKVVKHVLRDQLAAKRNSDTSGAPFDRKVVASIACPHRARAHANAGPKLSSMIATRFDCPRPVRRNICELAHEFVIMALIMPLVIGTISVYFIFRQAETDRKRRRKPQRE